MGFPSVPLTVFPQKPQMVLDNDTFSQIVMTHFPRISCDWDKFRPIDNGYVIVIIFQDNSLKSRRVRTLISWPFKTMVFN